MWGIYDTRDNCWLGTNEAGTGPKVFYSKELSDVAAQIADIRFGRERHRIVAREYDGSATRVKDSIDMRDKPSTLDVLKRLERGTIV
jgi:hypothetical protein